MTKSVAIITARGGSKRIPRKNIRRFIDKPIIAYSINAAIQSKLFDEVMVSTDDKEIARISLEYGAKIPFLRSEKNSGDYTTTAEVVCEVIEKYKKYGKAFQFACCIYPTAPFITPELLKKTKKILTENVADSVIPIVRFSFPIERALKITKDNRILFISPQYTNTRSQDLPVSFHDVGQFYWLNIRSFEKQNKMFMKNTLGFEISDRFVQDIDNEEDWRIAELKYKMVNKV